MDDSIDVVLRERIQRLYQYSLDHRATVGRFGALVAPFNAELERRFSRDVLEGVIVWHYLVGSTPGDWIPSVDPSVQKVVITQIEAFLSDVEVRWGLSS